MLSYCSQLKIFILSYMFPQTENARNPKLYILSQYTCMIERIRVEGFVADLLPAGGGRLILHVTASYVALRLA